MLKTSFSTAVTLKYRNTSNNKDRNKEDKIGEKN
jgi:hypothetical protein